MHSFSLESNERNLVFSTIAVLSIIFALILNNILNHFKITLPWWFDAPSVMGFYGILLSGFNFYLWKIKWIRKLFGIKTPIIDGEWNGYVKTEYDNYEKEYSADLYIIQTWSKISLCLKTDNSESKSLTMSISKMNRDYNIFFAYMNYPKPGKITTLLPHKGFASITYSTKTDLIEGEYFNDRFRKYNGLLYFRKIKTEL